MTGIDPEAADYADIARQAYLAGREAAEAEMAERWNEIARAAVNGPTDTELEQLRYGPGGRAHFADPRPGDFPGRQPEHDKEAEAS